MQAFERSANPSGTSEVEAEILGGSSAVHPAEGSVAERIAIAIAQAGGWIGFDRFMNMALHEPGGYYASDRPVFGADAASGSDFITAPELSRLFGAALAAQVAQALRLTGTHTVLEFGAGTGRLAHDLLCGLDAQGCGSVTYQIVELSPALTRRQRETLAAWGDRVQWLSALPTRLDGVVIGNEVLDAMPVQLWEKQPDGAWAELGVVRALSEARDKTDLRVDAPGFMRVAGRFALARCMNTGRADPAPWPSVLDEQPLPTGTITETHAQAEAFVATVAAVLGRGAAFFIDYGFPQAEYYHPQRMRGTLVAHRAHRVITDPAELLARAGEQDLTAHVNFTGVALAAQDAGAEVLGYANQARFLMNCGIGQLLQTELDALSAEPLAATRLVAHTQKLLTEHEMGELFKVLAFARDWPPHVAPLGFAQGDRTHTL